MIFCAGRGTRMRDLSAQRPKPMISVAGRPLVDHALDQLSGVERLFANLHYLPAPLRAHLEPRGIETVHEAELLETGGGLKNALGRLDRDAVYTMNTDALWDGAVAADVLAQAWDAARMDALLLVVAMDRTVGHLGSGDFSVGADGRLARGGSFVYTGAQIIRTAPVAAQAGAHFSLNAVWERIGAAGRLFGVVYPGRWADVGYPEAISLAEEMVGFDV